MTFKELEKQILELDMIEKAEIMQILTQNLTKGSQGIKKTPNVCDGDAWIGNTRIPVWSLVSDRRFLSFYSK